MDENKQRLAQLSIGELFQLAIHYGGYFRMYLSSQNKPVGIVVVASGDKMLELDAMIKKMEETWDVQVKERSFFLS